MCKSKNIIALALAMALVMCLAAVVPAASAADAGILTDVPEDHPYYEGIRWCIDNNLMKPDANGNFRPDDILTVADMMEAVNNSFNPLGITAGVSYDPRHNAHISGMFPADTGAAMTRGQMLSYMYYYLSEDDNLRTAEGPKYARVNDLSPHTKWLRTPEDQRQPEPNDGLKVAYTDTWYEMIQNSWAADDTWFDIVGPVNDIKETDIADWDEIAKLDPAQPWWANPESWAFERLDPELWLDSAKAFPEEYNTKTGEHNPAVGKRYFVNRYLDTVRDHGFVENRRDTLCTDKESILYMYQLGLAVVQKNASGKIVCNATEPVTRGEFCQVLCNAGLKQELMGQFYHRLNDTWYCAVHNLSLDSTAAWPKVELYRGESEGGVYPEIMTLPDQRDGKYDRSHKPFEAPVDTRNRSAAVMTRFNDVKDTDWFYKAVYWAVNKNIVNGTSETTFSPLDTCTRSQIITLLYRVNGSPAVADESQRFSDASSSDWYYNAALWAAQNGLVTGTTFHPDQDATRADVVVYLYRLTGSPMVTGKSFSDIPVDNTELVRATNWANHCDITNGTSANTFSPEKTCNRAEIVTFLYRAYYLDYAK